MQGVKSPAARKAEQKMQREQDEIAKFVASMEEKSEQQAAKVIAKLEKQSKSKGKKGIVAFQKIIALRQAQTAAGVVAAMQGADSFRRAMAEDDDDPDNSTVNPMDVVMALPTPKHLNTPRSTLSVRSLRAQYPSRMCCDTVALFLPSRTRIWSSSLQQDALNAQRCGLSTIRFSVCVNDVVSWRVASQT